jgi:hypothetical protein
MTIEDKVAEYNTLRKKEKEIKVQMAEIKEELIQVYLKENQNKFSSKDNKITATIGGNTISSYEVNWEEFYELAKTDEKLKIVYLAVVTKEAIVQKFEKNDKTSFIIHQDPRTGATVGIDVVTDEIVKDKDKAISLLKDDYPDLLQAKYSPFVLRITEKKGNKGEDND